MTTGLRELLTRVTGLLDASHIPFMVAGSVASTAHGIPRTTQAIDIVIDPPGHREFRALIDSMVPESYYVDHDAAREALLQGSMFNAIDLQTGWKVDFILRKDRPFSREEFERRQPLLLLEVPVFVASPEDTVVSKLEWSVKAGGSERQRGDIAGVLEATRQTLDYEYIQKWVTRLDLTGEWETVRSRIQSK